eukprot:2904127-Rhodomonas_salina.1
MELLLAHSDLPTQNVKRRKLLTKLCAGEQWQPRHVVLTDEQLVCAREGSSQVIDDIPLYQHTPGLALMNEIRKVEKYQVEPENNGLELLKPTLRHISAIQAADAAPRSSNRDFLVRVQQQPGLSPARTLIHCKGCCHPQRGPELLLYHRAVPQPGLPGRAAPCPLSAFPSLAAPLSLPRFQPPSSPLLLPSPLFPTPFPLLSSPLVPSSLFLPALHSRPWRCLALAGERSEERGQRKRSVERGARKEERGKRKEERGKRSVVVGEADCDAWGGATDVSGGLAGGCRGLDR